MEAGPATGPNRVSGVRRKVQPDRFRFGEGGRNCSAGPRASTRPIPIPAILEYLCFHLTASREDPYQLTIFNDRGIADGLRERFVS